MKRSIVIDTNAYSAFKRGDLEAEEIFVKAETVIVSSIVLGELLSGFSTGKRGKINQQELQEFLDDPNVIFISINAQTSEEYANIYQHLRSQGTPIPTNDMWIAAVAKQLGLPVYTYDKHFSHIEGLDIISKISDLEA